MQAKQVTYVDKDNDDSGELEDISTICLYPRPYWLREVVASQASAFELKHKPNAAEITCRTKMHSNDPSNLRMYH